MARSRKVAASVTCSWDLRHFCRMWKLPLNPETETLWLLTRIAPIANRRSKGLPMTKCNSCGSWTELQRHGEFRCKRCYRYPTRRELEQDAKEALTEKRVMKSWRGWISLRERYEDRYLAKMSFYERSRGPYKITYPPSFQTFTYRPKSDDDALVYLQLKIKAAFDFGVAAYRGSFTDREEYECVRIAEARAINRDFPNCHSYPPLWERSKSSLRNMGIRAPRPVPASSQAIKQ